MTIPVRSSQEISNVLLARDPLPVLVPAQVFDPALTPQIAALDAPALVEIGLHLLNDDLAAGHGLAQRHEGDPLADYWHAIIHRREGDYSNSRYWFRRVGPAPALTEIYGPDPSAPDAFVEKCRVVGRGRDADLERFQRAEIVALLAAAGLASR